MVIKTDSPTIPVTEIEQSAFCQTDDTLQSKTLEDEFGAGVRWQNYLSATCGRNRKS